MTEDETVIFDYYFGLGDNLEYRGEPLYWYRNEHSIEKTFLDDRIQLRLTHVDCFDDKLEGRAAEMYYDIALEELLAEHAIGKALFERLSRVTVEKKELFLERDEKGIRLASMKEYDAYIVCFSKVGNDPYMFDHYGRYCFKLSKSMLIHTLRECFADRIRYFDRQMLYGRQAVEYLKKAIMTIVRNEFLLRNAEMLLQDQLHELLYAAKRPRYSLENEVRFVVFLSKDDPCDDDTIKKIEFEENGITKKYLYLTFKNEMFYSVSPSPANAEEDTVRVFSLFKQRGYSDLLPD